MRLALLCALVPAALALAGQPIPDEGPLVSLDEGKTYRVVNGEPITGREVLDLLLEQSWQKQLPLFIDYALCEAEVQAAKIVISDKEVDAELQALLDRYAKEMHLDPVELKIEKVAREIGLLGGLAALRRHTRVSLGWLRLFQKEQGTPGAALAHIWEKGFEGLVRERREKLIAEKGLERDPKKLGTGEAVRIGPRGYARAEVRSFLAQQLGQLPLSELREKLDILTLEKLAQRALKDKGIELAEDDLAFHFSYLCRKKEAETGVNGRMLIVEDLKTLGMTPEEFLHDRRFKLDACLTRLAKDPIRGTQLRQEFEAHPEKYKRAENLVAHILIRVLDPDGRPYTPFWKAPGHEQLNEYAARCREERFTAAKPKIEGLLALARQNFDEAAKKYSEDNATNMIGGVLGRIGKDATLVGSADAAVRDAALALKPGEVSGPVRSAYGWHIVKCLEKQDVTYDEAAERVYLQLIFEAREKLDKSLRQTAKVEDKLP
jgi:hypothetical protein